MSDDFIAISGHEREKAQIQRLLLASRAQAYMLVGPSAVPKIALAEAMAAQLLATSIAELGRQPNFIRLSRPLDEKTGEKKKITPVELVGDLVARLSLSSIGNSPRVVIVEDTDHIMDYAQNTLLKHVEEPRPNTFFVFLADDAERVLPTLRSRVVQLVCTPEPHEVAEALAPLRADVEAFLAAPRSQRLLTAVAMTKGDEAQAADALQAFLIALAHTLHATFVEKYATLSHDRRVAWQRALHLLTQAPTILRENASPTLLLETIALALP